MRIWKKFEFDAAHCLPATPPDHKCHRLHGHTYYVTLHCEGEIINGYGWVVDYADIKRAWKIIEPHLDHTSLNDRINNPTAENLARWIAEQLRPHLPQLCRVEIQETPSTGAVYDL